MFQQLLNKVPSINIGDNRRDAYIYSVICGLLLLIGQLGRNNAYYEATLLVGRMRSELVFLIYKKLSQISQYTVKTQELGKIINMLSNDFNTI